MTAADRPPAAMPAGSSSRFQHSFYPTDQRKSTMTTTKSGHVRIRQVALDRIQPAPENDRLYRPVDPDDPEIQALAQSIARHGVKEPLVVSRDGYLLSGHRRYTAARLAGLERVPCRVEPLRRRDDPDGFLVLLREYNRQRDKTLDEQLREELVSVDPTAAYESLLAHRQRQARVAVAPLPIVGRKRRAAISAAKQPFLEAVLGILAEQREFWPLSDRRIHYALLNAPPLRHARKPASRYQNDKPSYKDLTDLLTRARLAGSVPFEAIADETRPVVTWDVFANPRGFLRRELDEFLQGYWRDLLQSQPNHLEILGEKNTLGGVIRPVAMQYCLPLTLGRGYCSLPPRRDLAQRFAQSGKERLLLLVLSDYDPEGEDIAHSFARSLRDDFGISQVHAIKVALTAAQVAQYQLPPQMKAKASSARYEKFVAAHGDDVFELEALPPRELQAIVRRAIDAVLDVAAFNAELDAERGDAGYLEGLRRRVAAVLREQVMDA
jgi:hypothetical protein